MTFSAVKRLSNNPAIIPVVVTVVCLLPFVNKAFHMDDTLFLWSARQIQKSPFDFYGFTVNWYGDEMPMSEVTKNPPLACYYIALVGSLFDYSEIALHLAFLIPAAAAALGTYYLARQFCSRPALAALAAVLTPGFIVSATNVMCDTMMLAFWVWAVAFWVRGIKADNWLNLFFAAVLIAACALTKYFGMALFPLLIVYSLMQRRRLGAWVLFFLVPVAILAGYQWATHASYGRGLLSDAASYATEYGWESFGAAELSAKALAALAFTGGCIVTALFYSPLLWSRRVLFGGVVLTALLVFGLSFSANIGRFSLQDAGPLKWLFLVQLGLMAAAAVSLIGLTCVDFYKCKDADSLLLGLWVLGTFVFAGFINWTVNARSILPMVPAAGILLMRRIDEYNEVAHRRAVLWRPALPLVVAAVVAISVSWADYTFAGTARQAAAEIHRNFTDLEGTLWFQGHWGFQYYMETSGAKAMDFTDPRPAEGDVIIIPSNNTNTMSLLGDMVHPCGVFEFVPCRWLATMTTSLGAGFYTDIWGPLPFAAGPVELEKYEVIDIR